MDIRQKKSIRVVIVIALIAAISVGVAWIFNSDAWNAAPPSEKERAEAIDKAAFTDVEREGIEALVHDYIVAHPEVITEALDELDRRQIASRLDEAGAKIATPFEGAYIGATGGDVTLVEFTDYACGFCRRSVADIDRLVKENPGLRVVFREAPILSQESRTAALWALAAAEQGRYEAFHRAMFAAGRPSDANILAAAQQAGMDIKQARKQIVKPEYAAELNANIEAMRTLGVGGTPTFVVGDNVIEGAVGYDQLQEAIDGATES